MKLAHALPITVLALMPLFLLAAGPVKEQDELMWTIERLVPQNAPGFTGWRATSAFIRNDQGIKVTLSQSGPDGHTLTQTFTMPGDCAKPKSCEFEGTDSIVSFHGTKDTYNLGPYGDIAKPQEIVTA